MVNQLSDKDSWPEKHRDEGPLFTSAKDFCPERAASRRTYVDSCVSLPHYLNTFYLALSPVTAPLALPAPKGAPYHEK